MAFQNEDDDENEEKGPPPPPVLNFADIECSLTEDRGSRPWKTLQKWKGMRGHAVITFFHNMRGFNGNFILEALCKQVGLSRLCSATFEQLLAFGATFCGFSNLEQVLPFRAIFEQNIGLEHISSTKKSTISWKTSIHANFLKAYHVINLLNT